MTLRTLSSILLVLVCLTGCAGQAPLPPKAVTLNQAGVEALEQGDLTVAEARFALALEYHPRFVDALVNLGLVELQRGNFAQARHWLDEAVGINRHIAQPHHGLGLLEERRGKWARAAEHYREALRVDPGFVPARANLARLYFEGGRMDDAREQFLRLVQVAPEDPHGWTGLADCLYRLGRDDQAELVVAEAVSLLGNDIPVLRIHHARILLRQGDPASARDLLASVTTAPGPAGREAWAWMGMTYLVEGRPAEAARCAEQALSFERNHPLATYVLSMSLAEAGDPDAEAWLARARQLAPGNSVISEALGRTKR
jgi:Flp pilus assembly protein TadD